MAGCHKVMQRGSATTKHRYAQGGKIKRTLEREKEEKQAKIRRNRETDEEEGVKKSIKILCAIRIDAYIAIFIP